MLRSFFCSSLILFKFFLYTVLLPLALQAPTIFCHCLCYVSFFLAFLCWTVACGYPSSIAFVTSTKSVYVNAENWQCHELRKFNNWTERHFQKLLLAKIASLLCLLLAFLCALFINRTPKCKCLSSAHRIEWLNEMKRGINFVQAFRKSIKQTFGREWLRIDFLMNFLWFCVRRYFFLALRCRYAIWIHLTKDSHNVKT